ncbi:ribosome maturation factor [Desulfolithobacter dissulfuricans]|uniref:Ribosome maturation factor RimP n=2 Tax=Desulfolithobacter dissulfuricans TaxID=2795293 RepID=A0A915TYV1_9BACT|nr:ribosome maturation factor [Desulfolithobacter dissulfuricans]
MVEMESENNPIIQAIEAYATPLLRDMGLELVEVQYRREGHGWVVRLFIDREGGVTIDDCASVSRQLSAWLDVEDLISHAYNLEVSSPGLERPLKKREDFIRFAGRKARVKLQEPLDGRRVFTGIIDRVEEDGVVLLLDEGPVTLAFDAMARARLSL